MHCDTKLIMEWYLLISAFKVTQDDIQDDIQYDIQNDIENVIEEEIQVRSR